MPLSVRLFGGRFRWEKGAGASMSLSGGGLLFDTEIGHEGEAADLAAELAEPVGGGVIGIGEEVVAGAVAADRDGIRLADPDLILVAMPAGVEFATEAVGLGTLDGDAFGAGATGLTWTKGAVGRRNQSAAGKSAGAEAGAGAEDRRPPAFLEGVVMPFAEAIFGEF